MKIDLKNNKIAKTMRIFEGIEHTKSHGVIYRLKKIRSVLSML